MNNDENKETIEKINDALNHIYKLNDKEHGLRLLEEIANTNNKYAQYELGIYYENQDNYKKSLYWFKKSHNNGYIDATYAIGLLYFHGNGVKQNYGKSIEYWTISSRHGHLSSMHNLSQIYLGIFGKKYKNEELGLELCMMAAEKGHTGAMANLGAVYIEKNNYHDAKKYLFKSANSGNSYGQLYLGMLYFQEDFNEHSCIEGCKWFTKSALQDNPTALHRLGVCYYNGYGVKRNILRARDLWVRAFLKGEKHSSACIFGMAGVQSLLANGVAPVDIILLSYDECNEDIVKT